MKKLITLIIAMAFALQVTGASSSLRTTNYELRTSHALRPMAAAIIAHLSNFPQPAPTEAAISEKFIAEGETTIFSNDGVPFAFKISTNHTAYPSQNKGITVTAYTNMIDGEASRISFMHAIVCDRADGQRDLEIKKLLTIDTFERRGILTCVLSLLSRFAQNSGFRRIIFSTHRSAHYSMFFLRRGFRKCPNEDYLEFLLEPDEMQQENYLFPPLYIRAPNEWQVGHTRSLYPLSPAQVLGSAAPKAPSAGDTQLTSGSIHYEDFSNVSWYHDGLRQLVGVTPIEPDSTNLDLGCGTGAFTRLIADNLGPKGKLFGLDTSAERIQIASQHFSGQDNVSILVQDATKLGRFEAGSVDNVFAANTIHLIGDKSRFVQEIDRALKVGGSFNFSTSYFRGSQSPEAEKLMKRIYVKGLRKLRDRGITPSGKRPRACEILSREYYTELVADSGLVVVVQREITYNYKPLDLSGLFSDPEVSKNMYPGVPYEIRTEVLMETLAEESDALLGREEKAAAITRKWLIVSARKPSPGSHLVMQRAPIAINQAALVALDSAA